MPAPEDYSSSSQSTQSSPGRAMLAPASTQYTTSSPHSSPGSIIITVAFKSSSQIIFCNKLCYFLQFKVKSYWYLTSIKILLCIKQILFSLSHAFKVTNALLLFRRSCQFPLLLLLVRPVQWVWRIVSVLWLQPVLPHLLLLTQTRLHWGWTLTISLS